MAAQTVYPMGVVMFTPPVGVPTGGEGHGVTELPRTDLAAPQLVMLANVALTSEGSSCDYVMEDKQMVELQTVGSSSYSDSEEENLPRCSYGDSHTEISVTVYPETRQAASCHSYEEEEEEEEDEEEEEGEEDRDWVPPSPSELRRAPLTGAKRKRNQQPPEEAKKKKKPFHCKPCQYEAECEEEFVHHIRVHSAKKLIVVGRAEGEKLAKEAEPSPEGGEAVVYTKGVIRCERCGYNTNRYDHYMAHLKHHSKEGDSQRVYKCTICTYTTVSQYHWKKHLRNHFPSKLYTCAQCCYFSDRKNNYVQHIRTHTGERPFRCPYCKYSSSQKTHLTRHMRTHSGERPFKCDNCSYLAANQHEVTRHARQVHNGPKPLCCPHCQYKTADRSNYKKHVELHVNPRQFLCPVCSYAASKKCNLQYHIKSRHPGSAEITMDVSKVRLRVKKPESPSTYYSGAKDARYMLTGIEEGKELAGDRQPINLSTKKPGKPVSSAPAMKKEQRDKTPKRVEEETPESENGRKAQRGVAEERRMEKPGATKPERKEKNGGKAGKGTERRDGGGKQAEDYEQQGERRKDKEAKRTGKATRPAESATRTRPKRERKSRKITDPEDKRVERKQDRGETGRVERERAEGERVEREMEERERVERERLEREERERVEKERVERERVEREREAKEKAEMERVEMERVVKERERIERERVVKERAEMEKAVRERAEKERVEREKVVKERAEMEKERVERERERVEKERLEKEKEEKERERLEKERERVEKDRVEKSKSKKPEKAVQTLERMSRGKGQKPLEETQSKKAKTSSRKWKADATAPSLQEEEAPALPPSSCKSRKAKGDDDRRPQRTNVLRGKRKALKRCQGSNHKGKLSKRIDWPAGVSLKKRTKKAKPRPGPTEADKDRKRIGGADGCQEATARVTGPKQGNKEEPEKVGTSNITEKEEKPATEGQRTEEREENVEVTGEPKETLDSCSRASEGANAVQGGPKQVGGRKEPLLPLELPVTTTMRGVSKPGDTEEDEGIHSHDGSDISDNISEGSDDSGLHGVAAAMANAATLAKRPSAPATPVPTEGPPAKLQTHRCIFCDRAFLVEVEYRHHLNRHLVNIYYLENAAKGDQ